MSAKERELGATVKDEFIRDPTKVDRDKKQGGKTRPQPDSDDSEASAYEKKPSSTKPRSYSRSLTRSRSRSRSVSRGSSSKSRSRTKSKSKSRSPSLSKSRHRNHGSHHSSSKGKRPRDSHSKRASRSRSRERRSVTYSPPPRRRPMKIDQFHHGGHRRGFDGGPQRFFQKRGFVDFRNRGNMGGGRYRHNSGNYRRSHGKDLRRRSRSPSRHRSRSHSRERRRSRSKSYDRRRSRSRSKDRRNKRSRSRDKHSRHRSRSRSRSRTRSRSREPKRKRMDTKAALRQAAIANLEQVQKAVEMNTEKSSNLPLNTTAVGFGQMTPQMAVQQAMAAMNAKAQQLTGIALPKYYNPAAVNPMKYAEQMQKRRLLWHSNKDKLIQEQPPPEVVVPAAAAAAATSTTTTTTSSAEKASSMNNWESTTFAQDSDGKMTAKFRKLMGIKEPSTEKEEKPSGNDELMRKQEELFRTLDQQYEVARMSTHTHRGVGLGFSSQAHHLFPK